MGIIGYMSEYKRYIIPYSLEKILELDWRKRYLVNRMDWLVEKTPEEVMEIAHRIPEEDLAIMIHALGQLDEVTNMEAIEFDTDCALPRKLSLPQVFQALYLVHWENNNKSD